MIVSERRTSKSASRPPESGGQRDEAKRRSRGVESRERGLQSRILLKCSGGTSPRATTSGRAALLTQEGVA
jgi:hypothetical protein